MKLYVTSTFPADPRRVFDVFQSSAFEDRLAEQTGMVYRRLEERQEGAIEVVRLRCESRMKLPAIAAKAMGSDHLSYTQTNRLDRENTRLTWEVHLPALDRKVKVNGRTTLVPEAGGCRRTIDGVVEVAIPLIGSRIERAIVASFEKTYQSATEIVVDLLRSE